MAAVGGDRPITAMNLEQYHGNTMTGNEFRELYKKMGLTQKQLAKPLGITYQSVQKWVAFGDEQAEIHARHWNKLAEILTVPVDTFYPDQTQKEGSHINQASENGVVITAGRDASQSITDGGFALRPMERQAIELNRQYGNDSILKSFISRLLQIKALSDEMY